MALSAMLTTRSTGHTEDRSLSQAQETERARIARELHDSIGQKVALLQIDLDQVALTLPPHEQTRLRPLSLQVADIARELHDLSHSLHPLRLEILGLPKSIEALCNETRRQSGISITFSCDAHVPRDIGSNESLCLYRIAQEALHNVVKHSKATQASVRLFSVRGTLGIVITDTGQGFDTAAITDGLGLRSMRQRARMLNGAFAVHARRGGGTCVCVRIPFQRHVRIHPKDAELTGLCRTQDRGGSTASPTPTDRTSRPEPTCRDRR